MTISQYIHDGSTKANSLFSKLADTGPKATTARERLFEELKTELELHARLEHEHLLPALKRHEETRSLLPGLDEDSKQVAKLLGEIDRLDKGGDEFLKKLSELRRTFQAHVRDDRKELLPMVAKALTRQEADEVAEAIETDQAGVAEAKRAEAKTRNAEQRLTQETAEAQKRRAAEGAAQAERASAQMKQTAAATAELSRQSIAGAGKVMETAAAVLARASARSAQGLDLSTQQIGHAAQQAAQGMANMGSYTSALGTAMHEGAQAWTSWAQESFAVNVSGFQALLRCRSAPEFAAVQGRMMQEHIALLTAGGRRVSEAAARGAAKPA